MVEYAFSCKGAFQTIFTILTKEEIAVNTFIIAT
ncbi:glycine/D-amino acid oxidases [Candidatus Brocadia sinica JPN1]|uniref:Glycine/D-amino acid oxidases n=1 Tax=Candidatus Brocadia sinica JPN1 TaxID=1197129 RepID=A0ABQ0JYW3_9BACT|nr:glycine/D-amino acid oxidases [Candidatus Brocadia sinica JPN1]